MSVGLINDATQRQVAREMGAHHATLAAPPGGYPAPHMQPTMTAQQAIMQETAPRPPHYEQESMGDVSFDQAVRGIHLYYAKFRAVEAAYNTIRKVLAGEQDPPVIHLPTGSVDEEGNQIIYELDLKQTLPERASEDDRLLALRKQLGPWNNYFVQEYRKWVGHLARSAATTSNLLAPEETQAPPPPPQQGPRVLRAPQVPPPH